MFSSSDKETFDGRSNCAFPSPLQSLYLGGRSLEKLRAFFQMLEHKPGTSESDTRKGEDVVHCEQRHQSRPYAFCSLL